MSAPEVKILAPLTTYSSPSRTARVRSEARSVPASGSVYPMAKLSSPARILGRKNDFCSPVPKRMMVGPTVLMVTKGNGAPARRVSSKKMNWSVAGRPCPPYSVGHPMPSQPSLPTWRTTSRQASPPSPPSTSPARTSSVSSSA